MLGLAGCKTGCKTGRSWREGQFLRNPSSPSTCHPSSFSVVKAKGVSEPRILRTQSGHKKNESPSETEAGVYITALGFGHLAGV